MGLFVTEGFGAINDVWHLPRQEETTTESGIYVEKKPPVPPRLRREAPERVNANGQVVRELDADAVREAVRYLGRQGRRVVRGRTAVLIPEPGARTRHRGNH